MSAPVDPDLLLQELRGALSLASGIADNVDDPCAYARALGALEARISNLVIRIECGTLA
ncbi:hypothetical protein [Prescottella equi]